MMGFKSFESAQSTLTGVELMHMLRKGQLVKGVERGLSAAEQFYFWPHNHPTGRGQLTLKHPLRKICDKTCDSPLTGGPRGRAPPYPSGGISALRLIKNGSVVRRRHL